MERGWLASCSALARRPEHWFDDKIDDHFDVLRPLHYPPLEASAEPGQLRGGAHTDFGTLTLVRPTRAQGGLEVQNREGDREQVEFVEDAFVMNIGDLM
jgi:isopenicillin N synthase-like dioxygenase